MQIEQPYEITTKIIKDSIYHCFEHVFEEKVPSNTRAYARNNLFSEDCWAYVTKWNSGHIVINCLNQYPSEDFFKRLIVHESVHIWQYKNNKKDAHGKTFWQWEEKIKSVYNFGLSKTL